MSDQNLVNRREFVKTAGSAVAATSLLGADSVFGQTTPAKRRYAIIGTGERATGMWGTPDQGPVFRCRPVRGAVGHQPEAR